MPRIIACPEDEAPIALGDLVAALNDERFDPADEDSFAAAGPLLKRLANNRDFLADIAVAELKDRCTRQSLENRYSSQVIMLHRASEKYFIRANFWPSPRDSVFKASGNSPFFYHVPHDHNFSFLTVGYLGPGYWSEYYEYDYGEVVGLPGEKVDLRFIEKAQLDPGKVMLYRAHRDVHNQLPPTTCRSRSTSWTPRPGLPFLNQYRFDVKKCEIVGILTRTSTEALLALAANHDGGNARDLVESFAAAPSLRPHPLRRAARARRGRDGSRCGARGAGAGRALAPIASSPAMSAQRTGAPPGDRALDRALAVARSAPSSSRSAPFCIAPRLDLPGTIHLTPPAVRVDHRLLGPDRIAHGIVVGIAPWAGERRRTVTKASHVTAPPRAIVSA